MDLDIVTAMLLDVIRAHQSWAPFIVGALAFAESLAVVSLLVPSTVLLLGIGALVGANGLEFWPVWLGAAISAILGDWLSYMPSDIGSNMLDSIFGRSRLTSI